MKTKWNQNVTITTNDSCNLNCIYCYENKKSNNSFDVEKTKLILRDILSTPTGGGTTISFHGGEPFLVFDKIKTLCEWLWENKFNEPFRCFATTNGTLVHGEIQEWLWEHRDKFICGLSLDGTKEMHNANRSNSFGLIDIPFFMKTWPTQGVKMTISKISINQLAEGVIFLHELGISDIRANLAEMTNWNDEELLLVFRRELQKLLLYYKENPNVKTCSLLSVPFFRITEDGLPEKWCGVATSSFYDVVTSQKYPCHLFFPSVCGEQKSKESLKLDFLKQETYISKECAKCPYLRICPTCYGANYIERGHPALRDMNLCKFHKVRFAIAAELEYYKIKSLLDSGDSIDNLTLKKSLRSIEGILKVCSDLNDDLMKCT